MVPPALPPAKAARVLNEDDWCDLLPGLFSPQSEDQANIRNLHAVVIEGHLDVQRLRRAVDALQARHPRMRARMHEDPQTGRNLLLETSAQIPIRIREGARESVNLDLERELLAPVDFAQGPLCYVTYVKHPGGTSLLIFGNTHGVADGRGLSTAMAHLLRLYDGQEVGFYENVTSLIQLKRSERESALRWWSIEDPLVSREKLREWRELQRRHDRFTHKPDLRSNVLNSTFVEPPHPGFRASFEGIAIEIERLSVQEQDVLRRTCRAAGTTVTGAVLAAYQQAMVRQLAVQGRGSEVITVGMDMNHRRYMDKRFEDEMGNFVSDVFVHIPVECPFWETARGAMAFVGEVLEKNIGFEGMVIGMGGMSREKLMLMRKMTPALMVAQHGSSEHGNLSSLGNLSKFGQYADFKVLENLTAGHVYFMGTKVNVCTSGSSGVLTITAMSTKNVVEDPRGLARALAEDIRQQLCNPPPIPPAEVQEPGGSEPSGAVRLMQPLLQQNRERLSSRPRAHNGAVFVGDCSGAKSVQTHLQCFGAVILSTLVAGPLSGIPIYFKSFQASGAFAGACPEGVWRCDLQESMISQLFTLGIGLMLVFGVIGGYAYDALGAQEISRIGGFTGCLSFCMLAFALTLDGHEWPLSQGVLLYVFSVAADLSGYMASLSVLGFIWHYPTHQGIIMGLANLTWQASGTVIAWLFNGLTACGFSMVDNFLLEAALCAIAGQALHAMVPSRTEYLGEAGRVLNVLPDMVDVSSLVGWRHFKHHVFEVAMVMRLYVVQNGCLVIALLLGILAIVYRSSWLSEGMKILFDGQVAAEMMVFYATVQLVTSPLNPVAGILIDKYGILTVLALTAGALVVLTASMGIPTVWAQAVATVAGQVWLSMFPTVVSKWSARFAPVELFATTAAILMAVPGIFATVLSNVALFAFQPTDQVQYLAPNTGFSILAAVASSVLAVLLSSRSYALPERPPKNCFG